MSNRVPLDPAYRGARHPQRAGSRYTPNVYQGTNQRSQFDVGSRHSTHASANANADANPNPNANGVNRQLITQQQMQEYRHVKSVLTERKRERIWNDKSLGPISRFARWLSVPRPERPEPPLWFDVGLRGRDGRIIGAPDGGRVYPGTHAGSNGPGAHAGGGLAPSRAVSRAASIAGSRAGSHARARAPVRAASHAGSRADGGGGDATRW